MMIFQKLRIGVKTTQGATTPERCQTIAKTLFGSQNVSLSIRWHCLHV